VLEERDKQFFSYLTPRARQSRIKQYAVYLAELGVDERHARRDLLKGELTEDGCCFRCRDTSGHRLKFDVEEVNLWVPIVYHLYD
ncbi:hypothetical protein FRC03_008227, partial [Tulasnella sp. 419]